MPRVTPEGKKNEWIAASRDGKTAQEIAKEHRADPRTVGRALKSHRERELQKEAQVTMRQEALRKHQEALLTFLSRIRDSLGPASQGLRLPGSLHETPDRTSLAAGSVKGLSQPTAKVTLDLEQDVWWELLRQHLGKDGVMTALRAWKQALIGEVRARLELRAHIVRTITQRANGWPGLVIGLDPAKPNSITQLAVRQIEDAVVDKVLGQVASLPKVTVQDDGHFYVNLKEPLAGHVKSMTREVKETLKKLPQILTRGEEARLYERKYTATVKTAEQAKSAIDILRAGFHVPGTCQACRG